MAADPPLMVGIVGKKNSGKTTLLVAVAAELKRRGLRVASVKHGHHAFEIDHVGRDSWRHVHEGGVEAMLLISATKGAMVMHFPDREPELKEMVDRHLGGGGYDVILVEGYKYGDLPKIEVHRLGAHDAPIYDRADLPAADRFLAMVTDDPGIDVSCPVIPLDPIPGKGVHVAAVADLIARLASGRSVDG